MKSEFDTLFKKLIKESADSDYDDDEPEMTEEEFLSFASEEDKAIIDKLKTVDFSYHEMDQQFSKVHRGTGTWSCITNIHSEKTGKNNWAISVFDGYNMFLGTHEYFNDLKEAIAAFIPVIDKKSESLNASLHDKDNSYYYDSIKKRLDGLTELKADLQKTIE